MTRITDMCSDVKGQGQGHKVMSSVWCVFAHNSTTKSRRNNRNWQEGCLSNGWHSAPVPR